MSRFALCPALLSVGLVLFGCVGSDGTDPEPDPLLFSTSAGVDPRPQTLALPSGSIAGIAWAGWSDSAWLSIDPTSGDLAASGPVKVSVIVTVSGLAAGTYQGNLTINTDIRKILPANNEYAGWNRVATSVQAQTQQQLFDVINGDGMNYIDKGWVETIWQNYTDGQQNIATRLSDMGSATNATAMYDAVLPTITGATSVSVGDVAVVDNNLVGSYTLTATRGKFVLQANVDTKTAASLASLQGLAASIVVKMDALGSTVQPLSAPVSLTIN